MTDIHKLRLVGPETAEWVDTVWTDLRVPANATSVNPATSKPDQGAFPVGASYTKSLLFDGGTEETVTFNVQLPHEYKLGTDLVPHVHWAATTIEASKTIRWDFNYRLALYEGTFPGSDTLMTATFDDTTVANRHVVTALGDLDGSGITGLSCMLICALSRRGDLDTYTADVALLEFDLHYQRDSLGSREPWVK